MTPPLDPLLAAADELRLPALDALPDTAVLDLQRMLAHVRQRVDAAAAAVAGELARRSSRDRGYSGLAQRLGVRSPEALVQKVAGVTAQEARALVAVGSMMSASDAGDAASDAATRSVADAALASAVTDGTLGVAAASAIRAGLGVADDAVPDAALRTAVDALIAEAPARTVEQLRARAHELRDELDAAGVADRERELRERRYLHLIPQGDGMTRIVGLLDPESAALVSSVVDAATSPRRGGPRFTEPDDAARDADLVRDERTTEQVALDALVGLLDVGARADRGIVLGSRRAGVVVMVAERDLRACVVDGAARIEGQSSAVSIETARRRICADGMVPVLFDTAGAVIDVGRDQRLFTARQRVGLAARDGGCRFPGCDRPPSWCEAHHLVEWSRGGRTDLADGMLLCRHHHLLIHDNGWRVEREGARYFVVPPASEDPLRRRIPAPARSPIAARIIA